MTTKNKTEQYLQVSYSGKELLKKHRLDEYGVWQIYGEDPNCDLGGAHVQPNLGMVEGKLSDIIEYAVKLNNFWSWGGGGSIVKVSKPRKITPEANARREELNQRIATLESELKAVRKELDNL